MGRVRLRLARDVVVEFVDRDRALSQIREIAKEGTRLPLIVYGPEGCGKTALFKQAWKVLEEYGYEVVYTSPLSEGESEVLGYTPSIGDVVREVLRLFPDPYSRVVDVAIAVAGRVLRVLRRPRLAILMDDVFQAVGLERAERLVKTLLNLIEYPPGDYESIVALVSSSEGVTRGRVGRHSWAEMRILWNMGRDGFKELYDRIPAPKPPFEEVWRAAGGNPRLLGRLYEAGWNLDRVVDWIVRVRGLRELVKSLSGREVEVLREAINDPDVIFERLGEPEAQRLREKLVESNLVVEVWGRNEWSWIDEPPPEVDRELGIGRYYAWQTPLHRNAVERVLELEI